MYSLTRDLHLTKGGTVQSFHNAVRIIRAEQWLGLFQEHRIQAWVVHSKPLMYAWDSYYGIMHFVAVVAVLAFLFFRLRDRYPRWRNTLALTTSLALFGFAFFPTMPPRLLPSYYGFVDTVHLYGGLLNWDSGLGAKATNEYAAMPSLHTAWSAWSALAMWPAIRRRRLRPLVLLYPMATIYCIIITANHYIYDALAGIATLGAGYLLAPALPWAWGHIRDTIIRHVLVPLHLRSAFRSEAGGRPGSQEDRMSHEDSTMSASVRTKSGVSDGEPGL